MRPAFPCVLSLVLAAACSGGEQKASCIGLSCSAAAPVQAQPASGGAVSTVSHGELAAAGQGPASMAGPAGLTSGNAGSAGGSAGTSGRMEPAATPAGAGAAGHSPLTPGSGAAGEGGVSGGVTVAGCDGEQPEIIDLTPAQLKEMLARKDFELINVHVPRAGEIMGTDAHISYDDVAAIEAHLQSNRAAKTVLYCRSGSMSLEAAMLLVGKGYCRIHDLPGGMNAWTNAGFPLDP